MTDTMEMLRQAKAACPAAAALSAQRCNDALRAMAKQAIERGTGARALRGIFENLMLDVMYKVPSDKTIDTVTITEDVVLGKAEPKIKRRKAAK